MAPLSAPLIRGLLALLACGPAAAPDAGPTSAAAAPAAPQVVGATASSTAAPAREGVVRERVLHGICDGSAAVSVEGGLVVAYDEDTTLYGFDADGRALGSLPLREALSLPSDAELDLEGAARDGQRTWWVGSHGLDGSGEPAPNRRVLFAMIPPTVPATRNT